MAEAQTEPSMDEILASIRRIIAEEDEPGDGTAVAQGLPPVSATPDAQPAMTHQPAPAPQSEMLPPEPVTEHTTIPEPVQPEEPPVGASQTAHASQPHAMAAEIESALANEFEAEDDFEDVFEPVEEPAAPVKFGSPFQVSDPFPGQMTAPAATPEPVMPVVEEPARVSPQQAIRPEQPAPQAAAPSQHYQEPAMTVSQNRFSDPVTNEHETLLSSGTASASADAFGALQENIRISDGEGQTLEHIVERMLQPMLKDWLDTNLTRIVEEKVEEEVRRIARRR